MNQIIIHFFLHCGSLRSPGGLTHHRQTYLHFAVYTSSHSYWFHQTRILEDVCLTVQMHSQGYCVLFLYLFNVFFSEKLEQEKKRWRRYWSFVSVTWQLENYSSWESALKLAKVLYPKSISKLLILWDNQGKAIIKTDQQRTNHKFLSLRNLYIFLCWKTSALLNQTGYVPVPKKTCNL